MRISALERYGLRCLVALAREGPDRQLSISEIAEMEGLSVAYASKLMSILRKAGLVAAVRGRSGGFCIMHDPREVSLFEVLTSLGGPLIEPDQCARYTGQLGRCVHYDNCSVQNVLDGLAGYVGNLLSNTTLQDLIDSEKPGSVEGANSHLIAGGSLLRVQSVQKSNRSDKIKATNVKQ